MCIYVSVVATVRANVRIVTVKGRCVHRRHANWKSATSKTTQARLRCERWWVVPTPSFAELRCGRTKDQNRQNTFLQRNRRGIFCFD